MDYTTLQADVDFLVDTDSNTYSVANKTRNFNIALDELTGIIIGCDGTWQWDDTNYTDLPIGTSTLTASQEDYSFAYEHLYVEAVEVKLTTNEWRRLKPIDLYPEYNQQSKTSITDFMSTPGIPEYYDKIGTSIFLYPAPNYTQAASLKVFFQRKANPFETTDTTKKPGFANHLHRYLSICVAYDWAIGHNNAKVAYLLSEKNRFTQLIKNFYSQRVKDETRKLGVIQQNNK
jgi:hypothetical protein